MRVMMNLGLFPSRSPRSYFRIEIINANETLNGILQQIRPLLSQVRVNFTAENSHIIKCYRVLAVGCRIKRYLVLWW